MCEVSLPHRVARRNPDTGKWEPSFSDDYQGGLDPYGEVPLEALRASAGVEDFRCRFKQIIAPVSWSMIPSPPDQECSGIGVMIDTKDFEGRKGVDEVEIDFRYPRSEQGDLQAASLKHRFYLHPNNVGVFKAFDYKITASGAIEETVLLEHWVTVTDFPVLREVEKFLIEESNK